MHLLWSSFFKPMSLAYSLKHLRHMFEPYFLMRLILCVFEIYALAKEILIMTLLCDIPVTFNLGQLLQKYNTWDFGTPHSQHIQSFMRVTSKAIYPNQPLRLLSWSKLLGNLEYVYRTAIMTGEGCKCRVYKTMSK